MGLLRSIGIRTIESILVFFLVTFLPGLPPAMEFSSFCVTPPMPLKGSLNLNEKLNNAEHLFEGQFKGPENIVLHNGELYTSIHGGEIIKINEDETFVPIVKFGQPCAGMWEENICGRPLGFEFDKNGIMYVADAYYGIMKFDMKTGVKTTLVSINDTIDGKTPKVPNSIAIGSDGMIYWTDSSTEMTLEDGIYSCLGDGSGRLIRYDPKTKINEVLMDNIHFANGVALSAKEDFVLVAETIRSRILRYYLKGPKAGTFDIFIDGLPGIPDNIKSLGDKGFSVALVAARDTENILIFQLIGPYPLLRKFFARILAAMEFPLQYLNKIFPHYYLKRATHWIGHFESFTPVVSKRATILHLDVDGNIEESFHGTDGSVTGVSDALFHNNAIYCGSPFNSFIGRVKLPPKPVEPVKPVKSVKN